MCAWQLRISGKKEYFGLLNWVEADEQKQGKPFGQVTMLRLTQKQAIKTCKYIVESVTAKGKKEMLKVERGSTQPGWW